MNMHSLARLTPRGRAVLVDRMRNGQRPEEAAQAAGVSVRTANRHWAYARAWLFDRLCGPTAAGGE